MVLKQNYVKILVLGGIVKACNLVRAKMTILTSFFDRKVAIY